MARPPGTGFKVVDAFSRIIRLGEGVYQTRRLSEGAMARTIEALKVCTDKLARRNVTRARLIATKPHGDDRVPFFYQPTLGGSRTLRG